MRPPPKSAFVLPDADSEDSIDEDEDLESDEDEDSKTSYDVPELVGDGEEEESDEDEEAESDYDWESDGDSDDWETDDESSERWGKIPFLKDAENVEFPVSNEEFPLAWLAGRIEVRKPTVRSRFDPHFMLYLVGDELGDGGSTSGAGAGVQDVVCPTLPEEVVEAVLLRLPAAGQARCRAVCRAWLALLTNPEFLRRSFLQSFSQTMPPLCAVRYCPKERYKAPWERLRRRPRFKGLKVDISFLPEVFHSSCSELHNCSPCGFMCISRLVDEGMLLCVLNPVNQSFRVLPLLQKLWGYHVVLLMETASATGSIPSFKVYVSGVGPVPISRRPISRKFYKDVAVYSSISGQWTGFLGRPDVETSDPPAFCCNGDLYTTVDSTPARLVRLSTEPGPGYLWDVALPTFEARWGEHWMSEFFLASHRGRLLCICGGIWMLDDESQLWVEIAGKCPPDMLPPTHPKTQAWLKSVNVCADLVVFFYQVGVNRCDRNMVYPVAYDMLRRFWRKAPSVIAQYGDVFQPMPNLRL